MTGRHAQRRQPRVHWLFLGTLYAAIAAALLFQGWTAHEVDAAEARRPCVTPAPRVLHEAGPVLRLSGGSVKSASMPARTVALTFDGGPDPVWTPRILRLLRGQGARATFFLLGSEAGRHPELARRILTEGHEIGLHTYSGAVLGSASPSRAGIELALNQKALAGTAGVTTTLLRMPGTTSVDTLCGAEWQAALRAGGAGYLLVTADRRSVEPSKGVVRQFDQSEAAYRQVKGLLQGRDADRFTTVTAGLGIRSANTPAPPTQRMQGMALTWMDTASHAVADWTLWVLAIVGGLGTLRQLLLVVFARVHVRRLGRFRPGSPWLRGVDEPVTVLVPAYNEEVGIASTVRSLLASTHSLLQIIVIDDGSTDRTVEIVRNLPDPRVTVVRQRNAGKAAALNNGLARASHGIVVMADADTLFEPEAIHRLIQPLAHPAIGAVSGNIKVGNRRGLLGRWQHLEYACGCNLDLRMLEVLECMPTVPGAIGAFRREALMGVGGVSEDTLAEDTDLAMTLWRAGWRVVYEDSAIAWTEVPNTLRQLWRQRYRWCYGTLQAMRKHHRAMLEVGVAGRFARRALTYLTVFQVGLPLFAPVVDIFGLYGALFLDSAWAGALWAGFLGLQIACAGYALRLGGERMSALWALPLQLLAYRQLMYLVVIQSLATAVFGTGLTWQRIRRTGTAVEQWGGDLTNQALRRDEDGAAGKRGSRRLGPGHGQLAPGQAVPDVVPARRRPHA
ncbi:bifunctional polysaccharide deacetylase/glycosyltransferase family 2 protein [Streptomyces sp. NPDC056039]|uniref:bifunctional polysaccharide deacetylase/glycosyltransferase family 2 protein n=1 Tax=Streptomyces sp. NPDC056039 TaxID=3345687 RepID=UPI0035DDEC80